MCAFFISIILQILTLIKKQPFQPSNRLLVNCLLCKYYLHLAGIIFSDQPKKLFMLKKLLLFLVFAHLYNGSQAQNVVFSEDFENPPGSVSTYGTPGWAINNRISVSGIQCDSSSITPGSVSYLETNPVDLTGLFFVTLSFKSICKAEFFDGGTIEYSIDGGATWTQFVDNDPNTGTNNCIYLGSGLFSTQNSRFQEASYGAWQPGTSIVPVNSWWQTETFDISVTGNQPDVRIRFVLTDGNNNGSAGRTG
jgi:hypothetical protein